MNRHYRIESSQFRREYHQSCAQPGFRAEKRKCHFWAFSVYFPVFGAEKGRKKNRAQAWYARKSGKSPGEIRFVRPSRHLLWWQQSSLLLKLPGWVDVMYAACDSTDIYVQPYRDGKLFWAIIFSAWIFFSNMVRRLFPCCDKGEVAWLPRWRLPEKQRQKRHWSVLCRSPTLEPSIPH